MRTIDSKHAPVWAPHVDLYDETVVWPESLAWPGNVKGGHRAFETKSRTLHAVSRQQRLSAIKGLTVKKVAGGVWIYGDRSLSNMRESGHVQEGTVSIEGRPCRAFTSTQMFIRNGKLVNFDILYVV